MKQNNKIQNNKSTKLYENKKLHSFIAKSEFCCKNGLG